MIRGVLLDIAGVLELDGRAIPGSVTAVSRLQSAGVRVAYVTNTSRRPRTQLCEQLRAIGYPLEETEVFTAPRAIAAYLHTHQLKPHLLIDPGLAREFTGCGDYGNTAVVVCDAAEGFHYAALNRAFQLLMDGAPLLAVGINRYYRVDAELQLDAGPFIRALEFAAATRAVVLGKPAAGFFEAALASLQCTATEVLMVGDDVEADVLGARAAGLGAALVRTGKYQPGDDRELQKNGALVADNLAALVDRLLA